LTTANRPDPRPQGQDVEHRAAVARAALVAGGGFATAVGGVLSAASFGAVANPVALAALAALCLIAGLTMFTSAAIMRGRR
jgi:hypothetical protein